MMQELLARTKMVSGLVRDALLTLAYLIGFGPVWVVTRLSGRAARDGSGSASSWREPGGSGDMHKMY